MNRGLVHQRMIAWNERGAEDVAEGAFLCVKYVVLVSSSSRS